MNKLYILKLFFIVVCCSTTTILQAQHYQWANGVGGSTTKSNLTGNDVATDRWGNVYMIGNFIDTVHFYPEPGISPLISIPGDNNRKQDGFIVKYDNNGNYQWAVNIGGEAANSHVRTYGIAVDDAGYIYITGYYFGIVDFNPGPDTAYFYSDSTRGSLFDAFIAKYDSSGNYVWATTVERAQPYGSGSVSSHIALDKDANICIVGWFSGKVDFDPGPDTAFLTRIGIMASDMFIAKYDSSGKYLWALGVYSEGQNAHSLPSVAFDLAGNIYVAGSFEQTTYFDPFGGKSLTSVSIQDAFLVKYTAEGQYVWGVNIGVPRMPYTGTGAADVAVGDDGTVYYRNPDWL